jgi:hypothetical protein
MGKLVIAIYFIVFVIRISFLATLDSTKIIEVLDPDTVICFQVHKRVWPAAQRDSCFWSHIRSISNSDEDQPTWLVINYTTPHSLAPVKAKQKRKFFVNNIVFLSRSNHLKFVLLRMLL